LRGVEVELAADTLDHPGAELGRVAAPAMAVRGTAAEAANRKRGAGKSEKGTFDPGFHFRLP